MHPLDDLAAHALDALDGPDRRALGHHLAGCPACRAELDGLRATAARLVRPVAPPPQLWNRILGDLGGGDRPDVLVFPAAGGSSPAAGGQDLAGARGGAGVGEPVPLPGRRRPDRRRRRPAAVLASAAAAVLMVVAGVVGFVTGRATGPAPTSVVALADAALADPANPRAPLTDPAGRDVAQVVVGEDGAFVVLDGLDALPEGLTYQLWRFDGPTPVSLGVLGDGTSAALALPLPPALRERPAPLAITAEDAPGAATPSGLLIAEGRLPVPDRP